MKVAFRLNNTQATKPALYVILSQNERNYIFKDAPLITGNVVYWSDAAHIYIKRAAPNEDGAIKLTEQKAYSNKNQSKWLFRIGNKNNTNYGFDTLTSFSSKEIPHSEVTLKNCPCIQIKIRDIIDVGTRAALEKKSTPFYHPDNHPSSEVRIIKPTNVIKAAEEIVKATPKEITDLKAALDLCNEIAHMHNAELFIDETGAVRAKLTQII